MRPEKDNIAAPELPGRIKWLNREKPPVMAELTAAGPVLVYFWDPTQLNSVRALPYVAEWNRRYASLGLTTLGILSPRFALTTDPKVATEAIERLDVEHPVALDLDYAIWHDYGCIGWPSLFFWGQGGGLRWAHRGEGEYRETEEAIQDELREADVTTKLPAPMEVLRATDVSGALLPVPTPEIFPGGSPAEPWTVTAGDSRLEFDYEAGEAWVVVDGEGSVSVSIDGELEAAVQVPPAGLVKLTGKGRHEAHRIELDASEGVRVWAISFAPGTP